MPEDEPLALSVGLADGRVQRWGPGEPDGKDIPNDLRCSDSIPGGHEQLSTSLLRRIDVQHADEELFSSVDLYGAGGRSAWSGYLAQFPRTHGDGFGVSPGAVGWSAVLRWDTGFREDYVDRDMGQWGEPSLARRVANAGGGQDQGKIPATAGGDGLMWPLPNESIPTSAGTELFYVAPVGSTVASIDYKGTRTSPPATIEGPTLFAGDTDVLGGVITHALTLDGTLRTQVLSTAKRYLMLRAFMTTAGTPAAGAQVSYSVVAVVGSHGLTPRAITGEPGGFYASDIVADVIARAAPQLSTAGIEATSFAIPHAVYRDPVTAEFVISDVNKYHLYDWGVYDDREFFFRQPNPDRLLWEARLSDGAKLDADGDTAEQVINGVFVTYTDATGVTKTVGPPGGPFDNTDTALQDSSSSNPVNAHGLGRKWVNLTLSFPTTLAGATAIGAAYLAERSLAGRRGTVTLTGTATHPTEGKVPCWRVRAGDWITLKDLNGAVVPRKIIRKTYTHSSRSVSLELDNTVAKIDAILSRVGIQTLGPGGF